MFFFISEIALFCFETAIALAFAYIFTLVLLCPLLYVATVAERTRKKATGFPMVGCILILFPCNILEMSKKVVN